MFQPKIMQGQAFYFGPLFSICNEGGGLYRIFMQVATPFPGHGFFTSYKPGHHFFLFIRGAGNRL